MNVLSAGLELRQLDDRMPPAGRHGEIQPAVRTGNPGRRWQRGGWRRRIRRPRHRTRGRAAAPDMQVWGDGGLDPRDERL